MLEDGSPTSANLGNDHGFISEWNTEGRCWRMSGILRGGVGG